MLNKDFKEFAELLNCTGVEYLIVGGYALAAHGHPRYTGDLDIWIRPTESNIDQLLSFQEGDVLPELHGGVPRFRRRWRRR